MNTIVPAYSFNLAPDRFDTYVTKAFAASKNMRFTRDQLIAQVREGRLDHMLLRRLDGLETLSAEASERAAINVIDFQFEPVVLQSMVAKQAGAYLSAVEKTLTFSEVEGLGDEGPLWIDTVHHACVFSVLYRVAAVLAGNHGYRRLVLLHQGQRPEPRLAIIGNLLRQIPGVAPVFLPLQGKWFQQLGAMATPDTAIFYLTDMPAAAFQRIAAGQRGLSRVSLYAAPGLTFSLDTLSGSGVFARRVKASHLVLEYPRPDRLRLRRYKPDAPTTLCPLEDWVFWPLMDASDAPALPG